MKLCDMWDLLHYNLERAEVNGGKNSEWGGE